MKYRIVSILLLLVSFSICANNLETAKELYESGNYSEAYPLFVEVINEKPKSKDIGQLNQWAGECAFYLEDYDIAESHFNKSKAKNIADAYRFLGLISFFNYDFDLAGDYYVKYEQLLNKAKKDIPENAFVELNRIEKAQSMLDNVEKITIIDSIAVPREYFFKYYRISPDCGSLNDVKTLPFSVDSNIGEVVYANENRDFMMWASTDTLGIYHITEASQLIDKTWHEPVVVADVLNDGGDARFPFMMTDGATLYFANNGENSIGGYDIFISRKDYEENEYMAPTNIGMPYNSPYDDYMLAIDETLGIGWWATDRNRLPDDMITIYLFIKNDLRTNYNADDENIAEYARIRDYKSTWEEDTDYSDILNQIANVNNKEIQEEADFIFIIRSGVVYTSINDFKTVEGKQLMTTYLSEQEIFDSMLKKLREIRIQFSQTRSSSLISQIVTLEKEIESQREKIIQIKNNIYIKER